MIRFKEHLFETKLVGKLKPYETSLVSNFVDFLKDYFNISKDVEINLKPPTAKAMFGYIDLVSMRDGKFKITVQNSSMRVLNHIAHEYTHVAQFLRGDLDYTDDMKHILWKREEFITVKNLQKTMKSFKDYQMLPWEMEAYSNQDKLPTLYKKSEYFDKLKSTDDPTLKFVLDNL